MIFNAWHQFTILTSSKIKYQYDMLRNLYTLTNGPFRTIIAPTVCTEMDHHRHTRNKIYILDPTKKKKINIHSKKPNNEQYICSEGPFPRAHPRVTSLKNMRSAYFTLYKNYKVPCPVTSPKRNPRESSHEKSSYKMTGTGLLRASMSIWARWAAVTGVELGLLPGLLLALLGGKTKDPGAPALEKIEA